MMKKYLLLVTSFIASGCIASEKSAVTVSGMPSDKAAWYLIGASVFSIPVQDFGERLARRSALKLGVNTASIRPVTHPLVKLGTIVGVGGLMSLAFTHYADQKNEKKGNFFMGLSLNILGLERLTKSIQITKSIQNYQRRGDVFNNFIIRGLKISRGGTIISSVSLTGLGTLLLRKDTPR